jgi:uncharacterized protein
MSIDDDTRKALIQYRIEQAKETVEEAKLLLDHDKFRAAVNRIYYGMFYMLLALALKYRFETSKHTQLIGWFNGTFIKDGTIPRKYGKIIQKAFEMRNQSDYEMSITLAKDDVVKKYEDMQDFINTLESFILSVP